MGWKTAAPGSEAQNEEGQLQEAGETEKMRLSPPQYVPDIYSAAP